MGASTTNHPLLYQEETPPRLLVQSACSPTPQLLLRPGLDWTTSLTSCTPRGPSSTGMSVRVWRRENSPRQGRILPPSRRITRRSALTLLRLEMMERATSISSSDSYACFNLYQKNF